MRTTTRNRTYNRCLCLFATVLTGHIGTNLLPVVLNHILLSHLYQVFVCCTSGKGDFFILRASGQSMIEAGIDDGDLVVVKKQVEANEDYHKE